MFKKSRLSFKNILSYNLCLETNFSYPSDSDVYIITCLAQSCRRIFTYQQTNSKNCTSGLLQQGSSSSELWKKALMIVMKYLAA